jgi:hypothetical protein
MRRLAVSLLALALVGCGSPLGVPLASRDGSTLAARQASTDLYPLTKGMHWRYRTIHQTGDGPERPGDDQFMTVTESEAQQGGVRAVLLRRIGAREMPLTLAVSDGSGVVLSRLHAPEDGSITILSYPLQPQKSWAGRSWGTHAAETISVVGVESVTVPAGTFTATRLQHRIAYATGKSDLLHYWYAPGVGMVKAIEGLTIDMGAGPFLQQVTAELAEWGSRSAAAPAR